MWSGPAGTVKYMVKMLFHPDADPAIVAEAERGMPAQRREQVIGIKLEAACRRLSTG